MKTDKAMIMMPIITFICTIIIFCCYISATNSAKIYKVNAMDLCAWHSRVILYKNDPAGDITNEARYTRIRQGIDKCLFCGQKHDENWVSYNAWDSQINTLDLKEF